MRELIYIDEAIEAIHNLYAIHGSEGSWIDQKDAFNAISNLPPAQPEPERTMEEFMYGQDMGNPEDGSL